MPALRSLTLLLLSSAALLAQSTADSETAEGDKLAAQKKWSDAAQHYQKAVAADPSSPMAEALLGIALIRAGKERDGVNELNKCPGMGAAAKSTIGILVRLGEELLQENRPNPDSDVLSCAYRIEPDNDRVAKDWGLVKAKHGNSNDALAIWKSSLARNPNQVDVRQLVAAEEQKIAQRNPHPPTPQPPSQPAAPFNSVDTKEIAGWVLLPDGNTLVVATPSAAELVYVNTAAEREQKRVSLDFKPGSLVLHSGALYASAQGAAFVYALDPATGQQKKEIKVTGDPIVELGCAPDKGLLYATNAHEEVIAIDPKDGTATKTEAKGHYVVVDPAGNFVYTMRTNPNQWDVKVEKGKDGSETYYWDDWGYRAILMKYSVSGRSLKHVATNNNGAVNAHSLRLSPDGKRIAAVGGGGWRPKAGGSGAGGYVIAFFDTGDMTTMRGQVDTNAYPIDLAFHTVLPYGIAYHEGVDSSLLLFKATSLGEVRSWKTDKLRLSPGATSEIAFAARGSKALLIVKGSPGERSGGHIFFIPLDLGEDERKALDKAYGGSQGASEIQKLFDQAEAAEKAGKKDDAIKLYRQVAKQDPNGDLGNKAARKVLELEDK